MLPMATSVALATAHSLSLRSLSSVIATTDLCSRYVAESWKGPDMVFLDFFEMGADGKMRKASRSIFPVADAGKDKGDRRFQLPREGKTVLVRHQHGGKTLRKLPWNGERFPDEN
jgi:hypothetical protein